MKLILVVLTLLLNLATFGFADYLFAHCSKSGSDYGYIQPEWCKEKFGAQDWGCNGPCLERNARYCLFDDAHKTQLCKFKDWCETDGSIPMAKLCGYTASTPSFCSEDRVIQKYIYKNITECTTIYIGA